MQQRSCPRCGGTDRFYFVARPRNGSAPFWTCNQCRYSESATGSDLAASGERKSIRKLTQEEQELAHYGYHAVAEWCATALWTPAGVQALAFLKARGLSDEIIHDARLGYHPDVWNGGVGPALWHRDKAAYDGARLGGLLGPQGKPKQVLRGVVTIPYHAGGQVTLIRARKLDPAAKAKYLSPAGVELYAGATPSLYLSNTIADLQDGETIILTEGEFKALLPRQYGITAVAQPGVGYLPESFLRQLARKTVVITYDVEERSDPFRLSPGEQWTLRTVERLTSIDTQRRLRTINSAVSDLRKQVKDATPEEQMLLMAQLDAMAAQAQILRSRMDEMDRLAIRARVLRLPRQSDQKKVDLDMYLRANGPDELRTLIETAQDAVLWHKLHSGGGFDYRDGGMHNGEFVANYQARIVETVFQCDGLATTALQRIALRSPSGRLLHSDISADEWADDRLARLSLRAGLREGTFDDNPREVLRAVRLLSNQGDSPLERTVYTCTGWEQINGRWNFLASDGAITANGMTQVVRAEIDPSAIGNHYHMCGPGDPQAGAQAWLSLLRGDVCPQKLALILAAQAALPLLHVFSGNTARSLIWLFHQSGALKTALIRAGVMALYGPAFTAERADGASVPKWDATSVGLGMLVFYYRDMPLLIDDYKQGVIHPDQFKRFLHNYSESTGRTRGTKNQQIDRIRPARCIVFSTAEDLPSIGDYGIEARLMAMQLRPDATKPEALAQLQRAGAAGDLAAFWRGFIQSLASGLDSFGALGMRERLQAIIRADDSSLPGHKRAAGALRQNRVAWLFLSHWLTESGYISADEKTRLDAAHLEARGLLADVLVARQEESRPASIFRTVLAELIDAGELVVEQPGMTCPRCDAPLRPSADGWYCTGVNERDMACQYHLPTSRIIGFVCEDGSYGIYAEKAFREVSRVRNDQRQPFAFSSTAIWQQLDADGLLERPGKEGRGRYTVNRRNPARVDDRGHGKPQRVLVLAERALNDAKNVDGVENMGSWDHMGSRGDLAHQNAELDQRTTWDQMGSHGITNNGSRICDPIDPTVIPCMGSQISASECAESGRDPMIPCFEDTIDISLKNTDTTSQQRIIRSPENVNARLHRERITRARALLRSVGTSAEIATDLESLPESKLRQLIVKLEKRRETTSA